MRGAGKAMDATEETTPRLPHEIRNRQRAPGSGAGGMRTPDAVLFATGQLEMSGIERPAGAQMRLKDYTRAYKLGKNLP
jgi:hypothetical protein